MNASFIDGAGQAIAFRKDDKRPTDKDDPNEVTRKGDEEVRESVNKFRDYGGHRASNEQSGESSQVQQSGESNQVRLFDCSVPFPTWLIWRCLKQSQ
jgi:hypothetical protein